MSYTFVLEKTLESPWDCKEIQPVHSEGDQPWDFFGRNDAKAETLVLWPLHAKSWLIGKDSDAGRDWGQEEKGMREDEMAGWHHWLDGRESEWTPGVGDGQRGLACCNSWGRKESDTTEWLNWTDWIRKYFMEKMSLAWGLKYPGQSVWQWWENSRHRKRKEDIQMNFSKEFYKHEQEKQRAKGCAIWSSSILGKQISLISNSAILSNFSVSFTWYITKLTHL